MSSYYIKRIRQQLFEKHECTSCSVVRYKFSSLLFSHLHFAVSKSVDLVTVRAKNHGWKQCFSFLIFVKFINNDLNLL